MFGEPEHAMFVLVNESHVNVGPFWTQQQAENFRDVYCLFPIQWSVKTMMDITRFADTPDANPATIPFAVYSKSYRDDCDKTGRLCKCKHEYYRHFDTYDDMRPVGCKYCDCSTFTPKKKKP